MRTTIKYLFGLIFLMFGIAPIAITGNGLTKPVADIDSSKIEVFTFTSNGKEMKGKIYLPPAYENNNSLPAVYLIDFTEQHFKMAPDEFEKVIGGVNQLYGIDALVVSLDGIPDIDAEPDNFEEHYAIFKDMAGYVSTKYTEHPSRTFIGKGSESGVVLMALFLDNPENPLFDQYIVTDPSPLYATAIIKLIEKDDFPKNKINKKLHYSFSTSNDRAKCTKLINLIKDSNYEWLQVKSIEYTNSNYENTYPISYAEGIKYVYNK